MLKIKLSKNESGLITGTITQDKKEYSFVSECSDHKENRADVKRLISEEIEKYSPEAVADFMKTVDDRVLAYRW